MICPITVSLAIQVGVTIRPSPSTIVHHRLLSPSLIDHHRSPLKKAKKGF
jgi:hypothetical protein